MHIMQMGDNLDKNIMSNLHKCLTPTSLTPICHNGAVGISGAFQCESGENAGRGLYALL